MSQAFKSGDNISEIWSACMTSMAGKWWAAPNSTNLLRAFLPYFFKALLRMQITYIRVPYMRLIGMAVNVIYWQCLIVTGHKGKDIADFSNGFLVFAWSCPLEASMIKTSCHWHWDNFSHLSASSNHTFYSPPICVFNELEQICMQLISKVKHQYMSNEIQSLRFTRFSSQVEICLFCFTRSYCSVYGPFKIAAVAHNWLIQCYIRVQEGSSMIQNAKLRRISHLSSQMLQDYQDCRSLDSSCSTEKQ